MMRASRFFHTSFFRFLIVGSTASIVHYGVYLLLLKVLDVNLAYSLGFLIAFIYNWLLTSLYTFHQRPSLRGLIGMSAAQGVNYLLHIGLLSLWLWVGVPAWLAPAPVYAIAVPISFLMMRFVFTKKK